MKRVQKALLSSSLVLVIGAGAGAYAWFEGYKKNQKLESQAEQDKRLFSFGRIHLARIELKNEHGLFVFEKNANHDWIITSPIRWPAHQDVVNQIADQMAAIKSHVDITNDASQEQLQQYGISKPSVSVSVTRKNGEQFELRVGLKHNFENGYYISDQNQKRIGLAPAHFYDLFTRALDSFRAKHALPYRSDLMTRVIIQKHDQPKVTLEKKDKAWFVNEKPADFTIISKFLMILTRDLRVENFVTDNFDVTSKEQRELYGFEPESFKLEVALSDAKTVQTWISQAPETLGERGPFLHVVGTKSVVRIYENFLSDINKDAYIFRDRSISRFERDEVNSIKLRYSTGKRSKLVKKGEDWVFEGPNPKTAKPWRVDTLVMKFSRLSSDEIVTESATKDEISRWQLTNPIHQLTFLDADNQILGDIHIGKRRDDNYVYLRSGNSDRVDVIAIETLAGLPDSDESLATE